MARVLVLGATRGLGAALTTLYSRASASNHVFASTRSASPPSSPAAANISWLTGIDIGEEAAGARIVAQIKQQAGGAAEPLDVVVITAGYFGKETFEKPDFQAELKMYTTSAIGPVFVVHGLAFADLLARGAKVVLVSSESGSITLRHKSEGGGNYAHHASKSALNMVGKLLSLDLEERGVAVGMVHPGFMKTEMTKSVGFDQFYEDGGAVTPDVAASSLKDWIETFDLSKTGQYWAPRGPRDIGTAEATLGKNLSTPLQLPW